jgi:hypothetical protein
MELTARIICWPISPVPLGADRFSRGEPGAYPTNPQLRPAPKAPPERSLASALIRAGLAAHSFLRKFQILANQQRGFVRIGDRWVKLVRNRKLD